MNPHPKDSTVRTAIGEGVLMDTDARSILNPHSHHWIPVRDGIQHGEPMFRHLCSECRVDKEVLYGPGIKPVQFGGAVVNGLLYDFVVDTTHPMFRRLPVDGEEATFAMALALTFALGDQDGDLEAATHGAKWFTARRREPRV